MPRCFKCGSLYGVSDHFCPECGERLPIKRFHFSNKFLVLVAVVIIISIVIFTLKTQKTSSVISAEPLTTMSTSTPVDKEMPTDEEPPKIIVSQALKDCLKDYVYGKEENWVNLAEEYCEPLLPSECLFAYGKEAYSEEEYPLDYKGADCSSDSFIHKPLSGKFGVYCPTKPSKKLKDCMTGLKYPDSSDATGRRVVYSHCWGIIPDDCMFGDYHYYCLVP